LVTEVREQRWNDKLETLGRLKGELDAHDHTTASLSPADTEAILALGHDFAAVWNDPACPMVLKKKPTQQNLWVIGGSGSFPSV
jgi:hypothetical protein